MPEMSGRSDRHHLERTRRLRRAVQKLALPCWLCDQPIDLSLDYRDPMSFTSDHVVPVSVAMRNGATQAAALRGEMRPAHRSCNSSRGDGTARAPVSVPATPLKCTGYTNAGEQMPAPPDTASCPAFPHSRPW